MKKRRPRQQGVDNKMKPKSSAIQRCMSRRWEAETDAEIEEQDGIGIRAKSKPETEATALQFYFE